MEIATVGTDTRREYCICIHGRLCRKVYVKPGDKPGYATPLAQVTQSGLEFHTDNVAVVGSNPTLGTY
jgi:hypothetical protein